jgi:putrescine aminotransferase
VPAKATGEVVSPLQGVPFVPDPDALVQSTLADHERYVNSSMAHLYRFLGVETVEWEGRGATVRDVYGREYIDCGGYGLFFHGHSHPAVVSAVREQLERLALSTRLLPTRPVVELARMLAERTPGDLQYTFFCNSGAEAVEGALKLARASTGRPGFVAAENAFHGKTFGALSATGKEMYRGPFEPLLPGFRHVPFGDAGAVEAALDDDTAAVILEPIQGDGGVIIPPDDYLPRVREACDRRGVLLILDEVQTGIGRTGTLFACERAGVVPDILTMAKSLGGGVMPIGALTCRPAVWKPFDENPYLHSSTFGGGPLACAAAIAALQAIEAEGLLEKARLRGAQLLQGLQEVAAGYPEVVAEVRGRGLLIGVEATSEGACGQLIFKLFDAGVIVAHSLNRHQVVRLIPAAVITPEQVERVLEAFRSAVADTAAIVTEL